MRIYKISFTYFLIKEFCVSDQRSVSAVFLQLLSLCEFKDMNMEAEEAMALKPLFGENQ
jgi:hypothetical protein